MNKQKRGNPFTVRMLDTEVAALKSLAAQHGTPANAIAAQAIRSAIAELQQKTPQRDRS